MPSSVMPTSSQGDGRPSPAAVSTVGLRKSYGDKTVLDGIDLRIPAGSVFALLGPNGAGKTTAVKILSTLITADGGQAQVAGHDLAADPQAVRAAIGVTGQFSAVDGLITGEENMLLMADLHHLSKREGRRVTAELLERFDLAEAAKKPASTYSGGMKRRLDIAMTLVGDPRIIFLDEPTTGLDPRSRHNMWQIIRELVSDGVTVFLTTQYLEEADELADRIAVLNDGKIAAEGTADELKRLDPRRTRPAPLLRPGRLPVRRLRPARGHPRRRGAGAADPQRRQPARTALHPRPAGLRRHRGRRTDRAHPRPRRRVLRPDRRAPARPGRTSPRRPSDELPLPRRARLVHDAAPQPPARAALPVPHPEPAAHPDHAAAALRLHLRRRDERRHRRRRRGPLRVHRLPRPGHPADDHRQHHDRHRGVRLHRHDRGHHRPLPHDGDPPRLRAHRARRRQRAAVRRSAWSSSAPSRVAIGFRSTDATALEWLAAFGLLALVRPGAHLDRGRDGPGPARTPRRPATTRCR